MKSTPATAVEFDFEARVERSIAPTEAYEVWNAGGHCWLDLDLTDAALVEQLLQQFGVSPNVIDNLLNHPVGGRYDAYGNCIHVGVAAPRFDDNTLVFDTVNMVLGERVLFTIHRGEVGFIEQIRRQYRHFFAKFAKSLGFLMFEFWDHLIDAYRQAIRVLENQVEKVQAGILGEVHDTLFTHVLKLMNELLQVRVRILADREVLHQLATHKSAFVPETAQPFLLNLVGSLERLSSDLTVEREILAESLNLYLGVVSFRTSRLVNRLTLISVVFMPLTFLCGLYGMNFESMPEFKWDYGYVFFWCLVAAILGGLGFIIKHFRWMEI